MVLTGVLGPEATDIARTMTADLKLASTPEELRAMLGDAPKTVLIDLAVKEWRHHLDVIKGGKADVIVALAPSSASDELLEDAAERGITDYILIDAPSGPEELRWVIHPELEGPLVGSSKAMKAIFDQVARLEEGESTARCLLLGDTGTGKTELARIIHERSARREGPFVKVDCGRLQGDANMIGSALFGHARGAFTGAKSDNLGLIQAADKGTVFFDEIGTLSPEGQQSLLVFLDDDKIRRVGDNRETVVDVRIIAATNEDIRSSKEFREDLYHRLRVIEMAMPPLRERLEDIPLLVRSILGKMRRTRKNEYSSLVGVYPSSLASLKRYPYPGNVRDLVTTLERGAALRGKSRLIRCDPFKDALSGSPGVASSPAPDAIDESSLRIADVRSVLHDLCSVVEPPHDKDQRRWSKAIRDVARRLFKAKDDSNLRILGRNLRPFLQEESGLLDELLRENRKLLELFADKFETGTYEFRMLAEMLGRSSAPSTTAIERIDAAFHQLDAGGLLLLARVSNAPEELLRAAGHLRDLLAFSALVEVCDRLLDHDGSSFRALELGALGRARLGGDRARPLELLARAAELARTAGESAPLRGRLHKQAFRASWYEPEGELSPAQIEDNRGRARDAVGELLEAIDAYRAGTELYSAINALSLLAILRDLGGHARWPAPRIDDEMRRLTGEVTRLIGGPLPADVEKRYWVLASRAEARIVGAGAGADLAREDLRLAVQDIGARLFLIDSTRQQLRMMVSLGFRSEAAALALEVLEREWALPSPAVSYFFWKGIRVVFAGHRIDDLDRSVPRLRPGDEDEVKGDLASALAGIVNKHGDAIVHLSGASGGDLMFAEVCLAQGVPYVIHLPFEIDEFIEASVRPSGEGWVERFRAALRHSAKVLRMPEHLRGAGRGSAYENVNRWMLASVRAHDARRMVAVVLWDGAAGDGAGGTAHLVAEVRAPHGELIEVPTPLRKLAGDLPSPPLSRPSEAAPSLRSARLEGPTLLPPPLVPRDPLWLLGLRDLLWKHGDPESRARWSAYTPETAAWAWLRRLDLRFEPIEQIVPTLPEPTIGFEVIGEDGGDFAGTDLRASAVSAGVDPVDAELSLLVLGFETVSRLRRLLQVLVDPALSRLLFLFDLGPDLLLSPLLHVVLPRHFERPLPSRILFQIGPNLRDLPLAVIRSLTETFSLRFVLVGEDRAGVEARAAFLPHVAGTKIAAEEGRRLFDGQSSSVHRQIDDLARRRPEQKLFIVEGIDDSAQAQALRACWPEARGPAAIQGLSCAVREPLAPYLQAQGRHGYRLTADAFARMYLR